MTEWLSEELRLEPGMRVLDLGCGKACSSIFLHHEFGVEVWAVDLWFNASQNLKRIRDAGVDRHVCPLRADARSLPFAQEFFDVIVSIDSFPYYGTDDLYLHYLARFLRPGGLIAIAGAGLTEEIEPPVPEHLAQWWTPDLNCLHSAEWWRRHWNRTGVVDVKLSDTIPDGWRLWLDWHRFIAPENHVELKAIEEDRGRYIGYIRTVAQRRRDVDLSGLPEMVPSEYSKQPLFRS